MQNNGTESTDPGEQFHAGMPDRRAPIEDGRYLGPERRKARGPMTEQEIEALRKRQPRRHDVTEDAMTFNNVSRFVEGDPLYGFPRGFASERPVEQELSDNNLDSGPKHTLPPDYSYVPVGEPLAQFFGAGQEDEASDEVWGLSMSELGRQRDHMNDVYRQAAAAMGVAQEVKPETREGDGPYVNLLAGFGKALPFIATHIICCARTGYDGDRLLDALTQENPWPPEGRVLQAALTAWEALAKLELMLRLGAKDN